MKKSFLFYLAFLLSVPLLAQQPTLQGPTKVKGNLEVTGAVTIDTTPSRGTDATTVDYVTNHADPAGAANRVQANLDAEAATARAAEAAALSAANAANAAAIAASTVAGAANTAINGLAKVATTGSYNDLADKPSIPVQVQADWNQSDSANAAYIKNKPTFITNFAGLSGNIAVTQMNGGTNASNTTFWRGDGTWASTALIWPLTAPSGTKLAEDAANIFAQRNGTNAQTFRIHGTFTDSSNYERLAFNGGTSYSIQTENAGTGTARDLYIGTAGSAYLYFKTNNVTRWYIPTTGHWLANVDNTYDIGAAGTNRPRTGYFGTSVVAPQLCIASDCRSTWPSGSTGVTWPLAAPLGTTLAEDAVNIFGQRNGTNPQTFRIYNTYTDASNYERGSLYWSGNNFTIATENAGTGATKHIALLPAASLSLGASGSAKWIINTSGHFTAYADNTYDIGASGANRPRTIYIGTSITVGQTVLQNNNVYLGTSGFLSWNSDTGLSRGAAGQTNVGNGTAGDASGMVNAAGYMIAGVEPNYLWTGTVSPTQTVTPSNLIQSNHLGTSGSVANGVKTLVSTSSVTAGNLIIISFAGNSLSTTTPTDSLGTSFTAAGGWPQIWYGLAPASGVDTFSFNVTGGGTNMQLTFAEITNATGTLDVTGSSPITLTQSGDIVYMLGYNTCPPNSVGGFATPNNGMTSIYVEPGTSGYTNTAMAWKQVSTAGSFSAGWTTNPAGCTTYVLLTAFKGKLTSVGKNNDLFVNSSTGAAYIKTLGVWSNNPLPLGPIAAGIATSSANFSSGNVSWNGSYWNGSAAATDTWTIQNVLGTGTNPSTSLTFTHSGSTTPLPTVSVPSLTVTNGYAFGRSWAAASNGSFGWTNNSGIGNFGADTSLSRGAAGQVNIGNGTAGDASGYANAAGYKIAGTTLSTASLLVTNVTATVASATVIAANTCVAQTAVTMTNLTTSMTLNFTATSDTSTVTGWGSPSAGLLYITDYPTANTINWKICNPTASSITTSAAVTFNVSAR